MITHLLFDTQGYSASTPCRFLEFLPGISTPQGKIELVLICLPDGNKLEIDAGLISSGIHSPEESLKILSEQLGLREDTLLKAAQTGRLMARRSGVNWLSTMTAVNYALDEGRIRRKK